MDLEYSFLCKKGMKRSKNQDSYFIPPKAQNTTQKGWFFALADGVGGYAAGDVASQVCCEMLGRDYYAESEIDSIPHWLNDEIIKINSRIMEMGKQEETKHLATTVVSLLIKDELAYLNNVGDSRIYRYKKDKLSQITEDHSVVWEYYIRNIITKDEIIHSRNKHLLTEAIGLNRYPRINSYFLTLPTEFCFLLCSDGLTDVVTDGQIENVMREYSDEIDKCSKNLYKLAIENGSRDDVTIIIVRNSK